MKSIVYILLKNSKHFNEHMLPNFPLASAHLRININIVHKGQINGMQKRKCNISQIV